MNNKKVIVCLVSLLSVFGYSCSSTVHDNTQNNNQTQNNNNTVEITKGWTIPTSFDDKVSISGSGAGEARVALDDDGNSIIVWTQQDDSTGYFRIFKSEFRNGSWTHPNDRSEGFSPALGNANEPAVAMNNNGNAIMAWQQETGLSTEVYISEYRTGSWSVPRIISGGGISSFKLSGSGGISAASCYTDAKPKVAMNDAGDSAVIWTQCSNNKLHLFKAEYRDGAWTYPADLSEFISMPFYDVVEAQLAMDEDGSTIIVWKQNDGSSDRIYKKEYRSGSWDATQAISSALLNASDPYVAMDDNGAAIIVWVQQEGLTSRPQVFMAEYRSGSWTMPTDENDFISVPDVNVSDARLAMSNDGSALIVWAQYDDLGVTNVFKSEYRNGAWDHPDDFADNISPDGTSVAEQRVAMSDNGDAIIIWNEDDKILKSLYKDGVWSHPTDTSSFISVDGYPAYEPEVRMNADGAVIAVWVQNDIEAHVFKAEYR